MKYVAITIPDRPELEPLVARYCRSFFCQLRGLMFRPSLAPEEGLLLVQSRDSRLDSSIHMMFMKIDLTIVWINDAMQVVDVCLARRWRAYVPCQPARYALELSALRLNDFQVGDKVTFDEARMD